MSKRRPVKRMFSLSPVDFRDSPIAGRGVFARRRFEPGDSVVAYAPRQRRVDARSPEAVAAAETRLTLLSDGGQVIIPDTSVPGGWLCNHSCSPNAAIYSSGEGRIRCTRPISPGDEVTIFYGWVSHNEPARDPCRCGSANCRGFINFDLSDEDAEHVHIVEGAKVAVDDVLARRLAEYAEFLVSIGQEQVREAIASTLVRMKLRKPGSVVCAY
ncbi:MAG TPA: SET domain-containing protein-lysine N-methyltransferase [Polyangiaceae bacterium]|nr:SET domain-containing protein-lysine N-methyltransferase [Polyangiaceae bacterium]